MLVGFSGALDQLFSDQNLLLRAHLEAPKGSQVDPPGAYFAPPGAYIAPPGGNLSLWGLILRLRGLTFEPFESRGPPGVRFEHPGAYSGALFSFWGSS